MFAIALTVLVLEIALPPAAGRHLLHAVLELWGAYLAYLTSFLTIGLVWIAHHTIAGALSRTDGAMMRINLLLLMLVSFLPFPTKLMGDYIRTPGAERVAVLFYGVWLLLISITIAGMWRYAAGGRRLLTPDVPQDEIDTLTRMLEPDLGFYAGAILLAVIVPQAGAALFLVIAVTALIRRR